MPEHSPSTAAALPASPAGELRLVIGGLVRRLRIENALPLGQATVLSRLDREGPQTTSALAAGEHVRPQSMAATIAELHKEGLVARRPHPLDRRQVLLELTARGTELLTEDRQRREGWLAHAIESELTREEQVTLARAVALLRRLAQTP